MKSIKIIRKIAALTAMLVGVTGRAGDSAPFLLDTTDPLITAPITYNSAWVGGDSSAEVVITDNGTEIKRTTGKGEFVWALTTPGKHTLTYTTYIDGVAQDEVYTATVFKDWKYTIEDGKATIVETTETIRNSDSLVIPHEIDGHMVTSIDIKILNDVRYSRDIVIPSAFLESIDINDADWEASLSIATVDRYGQESIRYERGLKSLSYDNLYYWNQSEFRALGININGPCLVFFDVGFYTGSDQYISVYINGKSYMSIKQDEPRGKFWLSKGSNSIRFDTHGGKAWVNLPAKRFGGRYTLSALFPSLYSEVRNLVLSGESLHVSQYSFLGCEKLESISIPQGCTIKEWSSEGSSGWRFGTNGVLRSGKIGCNASSEMNMTVAKSGRLKYKWKASSEYYKDDSIGVSDVFDYGYLEVDGKALGLLTDYKLEGVSIGGHTKWQDVEVDLTGEGPHTIRWIYAKDEYDDPMTIGEDCIWVDDIRFMPLTTVEFDIGSAMGAPPSTITEICDTKINLPIYFGFQKPKYTLTGWSDGNNTYSPGGEFELRATNVTLVAVYDANTIAAPKIESSDVVDGGILDAASATIKMSCDKESTIYYTLDGSIPTATSAKYTGEFEAFGLGEVTIKAIALKDDYFDSDVTTFKYTRRPFTLSESVNVNGVSVMSTSASPWFRVLGEESYDGSEAIRSGAIGPNELSSVEMIVENEGMISFWWKVSSHEDPRGRKFDYMAFFVDDVEIAWISGEKDWVNVTYQIANAGTHTLKWVYMKNGDAYVSGEDCAWLDKMMWMGGMRFDITYENLRGAIHTNPETYQEGNVVEFTNPSEVVGYTFAGWTPERITADMKGMQTVRANWTANNYTIAYNSNGGSGTMEPTLTTYDSEAIVKNNEFIRDGYTFKGWALEEGGDVVYAPGQSVMNLTAQLSGVVTFYAVWERILIAIDEPVAVENLVYNGLEQMGVIEADGYTLSGVSAAVVAGEYTAIASLADGYKWADGSMEDKTITWSIAKAANEWITEPKISLESWAEGDVAGELTDGVTKFGKVAVTINGTAFTTLPIAPGSYTIEYSVAETGNYSGLTKALTFEIIKYVPVISDITYENLRGATHTNPETYQEGTVVEFTNPSEVVGYTFAGWTPERISVDMTGAQTVRANWTANNYTVAYNSNGGNGTMEPTLTTYDSEVIIKENAFVRPGFTFKGWALEESGDVVYAPGQSVMNLTAVAGGVITLYAKWVNSHNFVINGYGVLDKVILGNDTVVVIPDGVTSIYEEAFDGCGSLTSVTIPNSLVSVDYSTFYNCKSLQSINVSSDNNIYKSVDGLLLSKDGKVLIACPRGRKSVVIPDGVTSIGDYAFYCCPSLTSVTIPDSVTSIGDGAFELCELLTSVTIPDSVTSIGDYAFDACYSLTSVTIPDSVTSIGDWAFADSSLTSVTIPDSVTNIGDFVFFWCESLTSVVVSKNIASNGNCLFARCEQLPNEDGFFIIDDVLYCCNLHGDITISDSVTSIGSGAFCYGYEDNDGYDDSITSITIPNSVTNIECLAFVNCRALTSVAIPISVANIDDKAFYNCPNLKRVELPETLRSQVEEGFIFRDCPSDLEIIYHEIVSNPTIDPDWGYVVTKLGEKKNEVAVVFTNHIEKAMTWTVPDDIENVQFLVVGGGGVVTGMIYKLEKDSTISVAVGAGGAEGTRNSAGGLLASAQGGNSILTMGSIGSITAYGGAKVHKDSEYSGGSGNGSYGAGKAGTATKGKVDLSVEELVYSVESFGNNGGYGYNNKIGGGGGGAYPGDEGRGGSATSSVAGKGGAGLVSNITGEPITYGSGGGGSTSTVGAEGGEGAGNGCSNKSAKANQGGGGGGAGKYSSGGKGGSGIVVIRYTIPSYLLPEVFPEVTDDSKVAAALEGSADVKLVENIKTAAEYAAFREWALNLEGVTPEEVKASPNAWLSYALNTDKLIIAAPKEGDIVIDTFEIAATEGAFEFTVKIDGIEVGDNALGANLRKVFDIEGTETLANGGAGFSTDNVEVNTATPESGNVKFSVTPKMGNGEKPDSFFFRVRMK